VRFALSLAERLLVGVVLAAAVVYVVTPYAIVAANRLQFYDLPAGYKGHGRPTPYLGGAAVMAGFVVAVLMAAGDWRKTVPLVGGVALLWTVGTIDDRRTLSPLLRVSVELGLAGLVWAVGLGWHLHAGWVLDLTLTGLWVLGVVNAFNLFDNMDGAASTMALVVSAGASLVGVVRGDVWLAVGAASLGGACMGFLPRNVCLPARIFLGDGGSMPMGFAAAVLVMVAAGTATVAWESLLVALLLVGIPALDTSLVIISRRRRGVSIMTGGRDHLTHRVRSVLPSARAVALSLGALQAVVSVVAVLAMEGGASFIVVCAILYLLAAAAAIVVLENQKIEEFGVPVDARARVSTGTGASPAGSGTGASPAGSGTGASPAGSGTGASPAGSLLLVALGLGAGISPFFFAYYDTSVWVPIGLGLVAAAAVGAVARPVRPSAPTALALGGLLGLGIWSLSSTAWAESVENAVVNGNRWLAYGALLLVMLVLLRSERRSAMLLGAVGVGVVAVAVSVLARLLGSDPAALFLDGRLNLPLGYINGEGCLFVMGFWLSIAAGESRRALLAGPGAGLAALMACLALLSQSRGTALAMLGALIVVVALVPGRVRRVYALLIVAGALAIAAPDLMHIYDQHASGAIPPAAGHLAGRAALLAALAAGGAWAVLTFAWARLVAQPRLASWARTAGSRLLLVPVLVALATAVASAHRIDRDVRTQWHAFTHLAEPGGSGSTSSSVSHSRLLSGGGNRYDYWRIAWRVWKANPVLGVGAGNYSRPYYEQRATTEDIDQPHSLELQTLSELGLVGALLLAVFIAGVAWGAVRMRREAVSSSLSRALLVASLGAFVAWLVQTSVDWMQLLPGLTAIALAALAVLVHPRRRAPRPAGGLGRVVGRPALVGRPAMALGASALLATLVIAGGSLARQGLADHYRARAQSQLDGHPAAALKEIDRSLDIDSDSVQSYYIKAAALARFDQAAPATAALDVALAREPGNFVTWALLGDLAVRERRFAEARQDYDRAHQLNPRDETLRALALDSHDALG
jgi:UDP-GlcNAc:undecaprenyl-phosphate/decaprenyl-phosphate GlcNAc-1-phosphate transferase